MNKKNKANKGFTLVELLVTVVIVGILLGVGIAAILHFIDRAKDEQRKSNEKTLVMAAKSYLQENRGLLPKSIGETTVIPISVLTSNKYITEDITNHNKESCMNNSYVSVYKSSTTKYKYDAHLYCGAEVAPDTQVAVTPTVSIDFVDASGQSIKNDSSILEKVSEAKFIIDYSGGEEDNKKIPIDGYSYSILIKLGGESSLREVYSSGTLSANRATNIHVDRDNNLSDYIDISGSTTVAIKATVRNTKGGINDSVEFLGGESDQAEAIYKDNTPPICVTGQTIGEAGENEWINLNNSKTERKITVVCSDGSGSGCVRSTFTKTWSGNNEAENDVIQIRDNAGNTRECPVRVNYDKKYPQITIDAFAKGRQDDSTLGNSVLSSVKTNSASASEIISDSEYANLVNGFMNKANYPFGVIYKVTLKDGTTIKNWKWEVNKSDLQSPNDPQFDTVGTMGEAKSGTCSEKQCVIYVNLYDNGYRKGVLSVYDKAGNKSTFKIYAMIDRRAPDPPTIVNSSTGDSSGEWTTDNVYLTLSTANSLSPIADYYYTYSETTMDYSGLGSAEAYDKWVKLEGGYGIRTNFKTSAWDHEMNEIVYISVCDVVGNCSDASSTSIKIDRSPPTGLSVVGYKKVSSSNVTDSSGLSTIDSNTWHNGWVLATPSGAKDVGSKGIYYLVSVSGASENVTDVKQSYRNINAEGISNVYFRACDKLNNCGSTASFTVKLDRTGPTMPTIINSSSGNWTTDNVKLTINDSYDGGALIGKYYYTYKSSATENGNDPLNQWVEMPEGTDSEGNGKDSFSKTWSNSNDMNKKVFVRSCDKVGNCSTANNTYIRIDGNAPTLTAISNPYGNGWANKDFSLTLTSSDGDGSGIDDYYQYTYAPNGNASEVGDDSDTQWVSKTYLDEDNTVTAKFSIERQKTVYIRVCDKLGNCSTPRNTVIKLDKTKPECGDPHITTNNSTSGIGGYFTCTDPLSSTNSHSECASENYYFNNLKATGSVEISDNANNKRTCPIAAGSSDCSDYTDWVLDQVVKPSRDCPNDENNIDFEYATCGALGVYENTCSSECSSWCSSHPSQCNTAKCCVYRIRTFTRVCYTLEE